VAGRNGGNSKAYGFDDLVRASGPALYTEPSWSIAADTIAKFLFTSGSTSLPKGVVKQPTELTANQQQIALCRSSPSSRSCWWTGCRGTTLSAATTISILCSPRRRLSSMPGKPVPAWSSITVRNLARSRRHLFRRFRRSRARPRVSLTRRGAGAGVSSPILRLIFSAGAACRMTCGAARSGVGFLPARRGRCADEPRRGAHRTAQMATMAHSRCSGGNIACVAGRGLKLVPSGGKLECGCAGRRYALYWKRWRPTRTPSDADGFTGPAMRVRFVDPTTPPGHRVRRRLSENFQLTTGTWVNVGALLRGRPRRGFALAQDRGRRLRIGFRRPLAWLNGAADRAACLRRRAGLAC